MAGIRFLIGNLLDGRRIQNVPIISGSWSEVLNAAGDISCTVSLKDPAVRRLKLGQSAAVGKAFLAAISGTTVLNAGPIWFHDFDDDSTTLKLTAAGMWSYFDHRVLLPVLAGRNPTDATTDTRYSAPVTDPTVAGYPWVSDTRKTLQGIARSYVAQAQAETNGNVPVILPAEIVGATNERWVKGSDLAFVGNRLAELTQVEGGPDIMFTPRITSDMLGVEWPMRIGTDVEPRLFSAQRQTFYLGVNKSSVTKLKVTVDGTGLASTTFASGGRTTDVALVSVSTDPTLTANGYPVMQSVDSTHSSVADIATLQSYSDEAANQGKTPTSVWSFTHDLSQQPFLEAFNAGDFSTVSVRNSAYIPDGRYPMRIMTRSGDEQGRKVDLTFLPMVV